MAELVDMSGFAQFYASEFPRTARSVRWIVGIAAEDVAQEAFIAALARWESVMSLEAPDGWVRLVAKRIAWRRRGRESQRFQREADSPGPPADHPDVALSVDLRRAIGGLPASQRAAIRLHYLLDIPVREIAELLGCTESAVKVWLHRARERLGERLLGHSGRWTTSRDWDVDGLARAMRASNDELYIDAVLEELGFAHDRWTFTLVHGRYAIATREGSRLDHGRYRLNGNSIVLTPWNDSGLVLLKPSIDAGVARFRVGEDTTAPTHGVPDAVFLRLLLANDSFEWSGSPAGQPAP